MVHGLENSSWRHDVYRLEAIRVYHYIFYLTIAVMVSYPVGQAVAAPRLSSDKLDCLMEAQVTTKLSAPVAGVISRVNVDRGDPVKVGQVVAELESDVEVANVALARIRADNDALIRSNQSRTEFLRRKVARQEKLRAGNIVAAASLDESETDARVAEMNAVDAHYNQELARQELKRAESQLLQRRIASPIDGVVVERTMSAGEYRSEQSQILTVAKIDPLNVEVFVPIGYFGQTVPGLTAQVMPEDPVGGTYTATVKVVDHVLDAASGTFGVRLVLPNPGNVLPAGLRCKILFAPLRPGVPAAEVSSNE